MTISQAAQKTDIGGGYIELFDLTSPDGQTYHFTASKFTTTNVFFNSIQYAPIPIMIEGMSESTTGTQPRPTFTVSNITGILMSALLSLGDLVGSRVSVTRTFTQYLDGGAEADPSQHLPIEVYIIEEKTQQDDTTIQFSLANPLDRPNLMLPLRQVLRDTINGNPGFPGVSRVRLQGQ